MRLIFIRTALFFVGGMLLQGQEITHGFEKSPRVYLKAGLDANSSVFTSKMLYQLYFGDGRFDANTVAGADRRLGKYNRAGVEQTQEAGVFLPLKHNALGDKILLRLQNTDMINAAFHQDSWNLFFHGNKMFEGDTAQLDISYLYLSFQALNATVSKVLNAHWRLNYGLSLLGMDRFERIEVSDAYLYTAPYGEYLSLKAHYAESKTADRTYHPGAAANFGIEYAGDRWYAHAQLQNFGLIFARPYQYRVLDTLINYSGVEIEDPSSPDFSAENLEPDSVAAGLMGEFRQGNRTVVCPWKVLLTGRYSPDEKSVFIGQVNYLRLPHYLPKISLEYKRRFGAISISGFTGYGGFGRFNVGTGIEAVLKNKLKMAFNMQYVNALLFQNAAAGLGFHAGVTLL